MIYKNACIYIQASVQSLERILISSLKMFFFYQPPTAKLDYFSTPTLNIKEKDRFELRTDPLSRLKMVSVCTTGKYFFCRDSKFSISF